MKDYLVTGAAGFIGSKLLKKLKEKGFEADGIDNFSYSLKKNELNRDIFKVDITNKIELSKIIKNYRTVIHLAAVDDRKKFIKKFSESNNINILGTLNILDLLNPSQSIVFFSSNMVYGEGENLPFTEKHPTLCYEPYSLSKVCCESLIKSYSFQKKISYLILRNFNTYGPGQNVQSLLPTLIMQGLKENKIEVWAPNTIRDIQYIDDCVENSINLLRFVDKNITVNLATGNPVKIKHFAKKLSTLINCPLILLNKEKPISYKNYADITYLKQLLKDKLVISSLDKCLKLTTDYYLKFSK